MADHIKALRCISCGREFAEEEIDYTCLDCGDRRGTLEILYNLDLVKSRISRNSLSSNRDFSIWRYAPMLPIPNVFPKQPLQIGWSPLYEYPELAETIGIGQLYIKDDGRNPTASYKDRATAIALVKAHEKGSSVITAASTGNAASSLAGLSATSDLQTFIFVPKSAPDAKIAQLLVYGATVFAVSGTYDDAFDLCSEVAEKYGWYNRSSAINPYLLEGKKTGSLEIAEQLNWQVPDILLVSVGDGTVISGICKGFFDLKELGMIDQIPQIIGVQGSDANPIEKAFNNYQGGEVKFEDQVAHSVADSISVGMPRDIVKAIKYVHRTGGYFVSVDDERVLWSITELAQKTGVFAEPAGAIGYAGLMTLIASGKVSATDRVVIVVTGNGLKDVGAARRATGSPYIVTPDIYAVDHVLSTESLL
jgi:threonine synthase